MPKSSQTPSVSLVRMSEPVVGYATEFPSGHRLRLHHHSSAQLIFAARGVMRVSTEHGRWVVPPERAVWIPPLVPHAIAMSGEVAMRTLYVKPGLPRGAPRSCRVVPVSPLLRELILRVTALSAKRGRSAADKRLLQVTLDEIRFADVVPLHVPMPRDPRAVAVARALLESPDRRPLRSLGRSAGASQRTLARLFARETGRSFGRWRQQASLLRALELLARGDSVTSVAFDVGYESVSAFIAMFRTALGTTPARYFATGTAPKRSAETDRPGEFALRDASSRKQSRSRRRAGGPGATPERP
jgi:AraC-like DNA-binding protein